MFIPKCNANSFIHMLQKHKILYCIIEELHGIHICEEERRGPLQRDYIYIHAYFSKQLTKHQYLKYIIYPKYLLMLRKLKITK